MRKKISSKKSKKLRIMREHLNVKKMEEVLLGQKWMMLFYSIMCEKEFFKATKK